MASFCWTTERLRGDFPREEPVAALSPTDDSRGGCSERLRGFDLLLLLAAVDADMTLSPSESSREPAMEDCTERLRGGFCAVLLPGKALLALEAKETTLSSSDATGAVSAW